MSSQFVLDFVPVGVPPEDNKVYLETPQLETISGANNRICKDPFYTFTGGKPGQLPVDFTKDLWNISLSTRHGYLMMDNNKAPENIMIQVQFGDTPSADCPESESVETEDITLIPYQHPSGNFSLDSSLVVMQSCSDNGAYLNINLNIQVDTSQSQEEWNLLNYKDHDFIFEVNNKFLAGNYSFEPCLSYMRLEGDNTPPATSTPTSAPQKDDPSGAAWAGVALGAAGVALGTISVGLGNLFDRRRRNQDESGSGGNTNEGGGEEGAANEETKTEE